MKQVFRFFTVWIVIVLSFGNAAVGFTHSAEANMQVNDDNPADALPLASGWIQTNWPAGSDLRTFCSG